MFRDVIQEPSDKLAVPPLCLLVRLLRGASFLGPEKQLIGSKVEPLKGLFRLLRFYCVCKGRLLLLVSKGALAFLKLKFLCLDYFGFEVGLRFFY